MSQSSFGSSDYPSQEPRRRGGAGRALLLIALVLGGGLLTLCCVAGFFVYQFVGQLPDAVSENPDEVRARTASIADFEEPEDARPAFSMQVQIPLLKDQFVTFVGYEIPAPARPTAEEAPASDPLLDDADLSVDPSGDVPAAASPATTAAEPPLAFLIIGEGSGQLFGEAEMQQMQDDLRAKLRDGQQGRKLGEAEVRTITAVIRGAARPVQLQLGRDENSGARMWQATATFPGKRGQAMVVLAADAEAFDEDDIVALLERIR